MQAVPVSSILSDYLPLVLFIAVSAVIGLALLIAPSRSPIPSRMPRSSPPMNAASTPSTMPA
jgi:hypothetical protein